MGPNSNILSCKEIGDVNFILDPCLVGGYMFGPHCCNFIHILLSPHVSLNTKIASFSWRLYVWTLLLHFYVLILSSPRVSLKTEIISEGGS